MEGFSSALEIKYVDDLPMHAITQASNPVKGGFVNKGVIIVAKDTRISDVVLLDCTPCSGHFR